MKNIICTLLIIMAICANAGTEPPRLLIPKVNPAHIIESATNTSKDVANLIYGYAYAPFGVLDWSATTNQAIITINRGSSWKTIECPVSNSMSCTIRQMAVNIKGVIAAIVDYTDKNNSKSYSLIISENGGETWKTVLNSNNNSKETVLSASPGGEFILSYKDKLLISDKEDHKLKELKISNSRYRMMPKVALDKNGNIVIIERDDVERGNGTHIVMTTLNPKTSINLPLGNDQDETIDITVNINDVFVAQQIVKNTLYLSSSTDGKTWNNPQKFYKDDVCPKKTDPVETFNVLPVTTNRDGSFMVFVSCSYYDTRKTLYKEYAIMVSSDGKNWQRNFIQLPNNSTVTSDGVVAFGEMKPFVFIAKYEDQKNKSSRTPPKIITQIITSIDGEEWEILDTAQKPGK